MNKNLITNLVALFITIFGSFSPIYANTLFTVGLFALAGGLTNWLAIHMLFEKIPFFYGSGVIPNRFNEVKVGIKKLIMDEFFIDNKIEIFLKRNKKLNAEEIIKSIGEEKIFTSLVEAIENSSLGNMLGMIGGKEALSPLKEPMVLKLEDILDDFLKKENNILTENISEKIEKIIDDRLDELKPNDVKNIIQRMIKEHLGWLVVWGGVIGGIIGLVFSYLKL